MLCLLLQRRLEERFASFEGKTAAEIRVIAKDDRALFWGEKAGKVYAHLYFKAAAREG